MVELSETLLPFGKVPASHKLSKPIHHINPWIKTTSHYNSFKVYSVILIPKLFNPISRICSMTFLYFTWPMAI